MKTIHCKKCNTPVIILEQGSKIMTGCKIEVHCKDCLDDSKPYDFGKVFNDLVRGFSNEH